MLKKMLLVLMVAVSFGIVGSVKTNTVIAPFCLRPICIGEK